MTPNESYFLLVSGLLGILGVPFIDWLKAEFSLKQGIALLLAGVVAGILGTGQLLIAGELGVADFNLQNLVTTFATIFSASQIFFKMLKYGKQE